MILTKEGLKYITGQDGQITLLFDSEKPKQCYEYIKSNKIKNISLYPNVYLAKDLNILFPIAEYIEGILLDENVSYIGLNNFKNLLTLSLPDNKKDIIDLKCFPKLQGLSCIYSNRLLGLEHCFNLKFLTIGNYKSSSKDLNKLPILLNLESILLYKSDLTNLNGIEKFRNLKKVEIQNASKLEDIKSISNFSNTLEELCFEKCKNIKEYEMISSLKNLKKLVISDCGIIKNLIFIKNLKSLAFLNFWGTNILDGNLSYCEGINYVGFENSKHYSHKINDFKL